MLSLNPNATQIPKGDDKKNSLLFAELYLESFTASDIFHTY